MSGSVQTAQNNDVSFALYLTAGIDVAEHNNAVFHFHAFIVHQRSVEDAAFFIFLHPVFKNPADFFYPFKFFVIPAYDTADINVGTCPDGIDHKRFLDIRKSSAGYIKDYTSISEKIPGSIELVPDTSEKFTEVHIGIKDKSYGAVIAFKHYTGTQFTPPEISYVFRL